MAKSETTLNTSIALVVAKIIRNSEVPDPYRTLILRDLCALFEHQFKSFNKTRFLLTAHGGKFPPGTTKLWEHFDTFKYLDEQYVEKPKNA